MDARTRDLTRLLIELNMWACTLWQTPEKGLLLAMDS